MPDSFEGVSLEADPALHGDVIILIYPDRSLSPPFIFDKWSGIEGHSLWDSQQLGGATFQSTADPTLWQLYWWRCNFVVGVRFPSTIDPQEAYAYSRRVDDVLARASDC